MALATPDDVVRYGYDVATVSPKLAQAETRVRAYLSRRASAIAVLNGTSAHEGLTELVVVIAFRMATTNPQVAKGVLSQGSMNEQVSFGAQAYAGVTSLTDTEKQRLDELFPRLFTALETFK